MFNCIDADKSGEIDSTELMLHLLGLGQEHESVSALFKELDTDGDGSISREEFIAGFDKVAEASSAGYEAACAAAFHASFVADLERVAASIDGLKGIRSECDSHTYIGDDNADALEDDMVSWIDTLFALVEQGHKTPPGKALKEWLSQVAALSTDVEGATRMGLNSGDGDDPENIFYHFELEPKLFTVPCEALFVACKAAATEAMTVLDQVMVDCMRDWEQRLDFDHVRKIATTTTDADGVVVTQPVPAWYPTEERIPDSFRCGDPAETTSVARLEELRLLAEAELFRRVGGDGGGDGEGIKNEWTKYAACQSWGAVGAYLQDEVAASSMTLWSQLKPQQRLALDYLLNVAEHVDAGFQSSVRGALEGLSSAGECTYKAAPVKQLERCTAKALEYEREEKAEAEAGENKSIVGITSPFRIIDCVRCLCIVETPAAAAAVFEALSSSSAVRVRRTKNKFLDDPAVPMFRAINVAVEVDESGHLCEVQICSASMFEARNLMHKYYAYVRAEQVAEFQKLKS